VDNDATGAGGTCLVVLTALRFGTGYGTAALRSAMERKQDVVLCLVVDRDISSAVSDQLVDVGFLGERVMDRLRDSMVSEYRLRGRENLEALAAEAESLGLRVESLVREGPFLESILAVCRERKIARILVGRGRGSHLSRLFFGSEIGRLEKVAPCPVEVFSWEGECVSESSPPPGPRDWW
jgi:nucleotide-binding universal stress UspA family protein